MRPNVCNESVPNEMCLSNLLMLEMQIKPLTLQCGNAVTLEPHRLICMTLYEVTIKRAQVSFR